MSEPPIWQFWSNWIVQFGAALGTLGAALVALFGDWIRSRLVPPKLKITVVNNRGNKSPIVITWKDGTRESTESRWYHVRIENLRRWSPARDTQLILSVIEEADASGRNQPIWQGMVPIKWRHLGNSPFSRTLGHAVECDLCSVVKGKWLELHPMVADFSMRHQRENACDITLTLQAKSIETDSNVLKVEVVWNGEWSDDTEDMAHNLVITELKNE